MRRWGQIAEAKPDAWYDETAKSVYGPAIYVEAARLLVAEGKAEDGGLSLGHRWLQGADRRVHRRHRVRRPQAQRLSREVPDRPEGRPDRHRRRRAGLMEASDDPRSRHQRRRRSAAPAASPGQRGSPASSTRSASRFLAPLVKAAAGDDPAGNLRSFARLLGVPLVAILLFLLAWASSRRGSRPRSAPCPGPAQVWEQAVALHQRLRARDAQKRGRILRPPGGAQRRARRRRVSRRRSSPHYTGAPTFYDQILTSIRPCSSAS